MDAWAAPTRNLALRSDEVHVWSIALDLEEATLSRLFETLSEDERRRAARIWLDSDSRRFVAGRGLLRERLGLYLYCSPAEIRFRAGQHGKPHLEAQLHRTELRFSFSGARNEGLIAVTLGREVGVDLEHVDAGLLTDGLIRRALTPREQPALLGLEDHARARAFFQTWTIKEAYVKARGEGLALPFDGFELAVDTSTVPNLLTVMGQPQDTTRWSACSLEPRPGFLGALVVEGSGWRLRTWR